MDVFDKVKRSQVMSAVRSKGNKTTERTLERLLRRAPIVGWRKHVKIAGTPDFTFYRSRVAVFVDGCFWHQCPRCYRAPKSGESYWAEKVRRNRERDRLVTRTLRGKGWCVIRIWECDLRRTPTTCLRRIKVSLAKRTEQRSHASRLIGNQNAAKAQLLPESKSSTCCDARGR